MYRLLVVDDEDEVRNAICNYFPWSTVGFEVIGQKSNGREALEFICHQPVDVVLCDIRMPVMSGIDLARECGKNVKIVFISAYRDFEYAKKALSLGVRNYIVKPCKFNEIEDTFSKLRAELDEERTAGNSSVRNHPAPDEPNVDAFSMKIISAVKDYLARHYKDATLEAAAELVHMNPNYLSVFFKNKTGQNFSGCVIDIRMRKAAELLRNIDYKIYDISGMIGYSNSKNFCRTFKHYYGKTPKEFRCSLDL